MNDKIDAVIASMGWDLDQQEWADMRRLCEAALAQQPAPLAVPEGWKLVPVHATREQRKAVWMHPDLAQSLYRAMVEAAPAAPAAVAQEPVAELRADGEAGEVVYCELHVALPWGTKLYATPPAAEQLTKPAPDELRARCDRGTCGLGGVCENCMMANAIELAAEQPDTVAVPRKLLERAMYATYGSELIEATRELRALLGKEG